MEKVFRASENRANFTAFEGMRDVGLDGGVLMCHMAKPSAVLGWGNYKGAQQIEDVQSLWRERNILVLRVRQTAAESTWKLRYWVDGKPGRPGPVEAMLKGTEWQDLEFPDPGLFVPNADGMELVVAAPEGTRFEIESVKVRQPLFEGYARMEFDLPEGRIWKAVADVGGANERVWMGKNIILSECYLNGELVEHDIPTGLYAATPVDIAPYLRPGRNCVAFHGSRVGYTPVVYIQATIIMESGEIVRVKTDGEWAISSSASPGWNTPGFSDDHWMPVGGMESAIWARHQHLPPVYAGRLDIRNPVKRDLFYRDDQPVRMEVRCPRGLAEAAAALEYRINRANRDGLLATVDAGQVDAFATEDNSIVYALDLGNRRHGVYALSLRLLDRDGALIEARDAEPFVVLKKIEQEVVAGHDFTEGLELELERVIDFTNPEDPHPWIEGRYVGPDNPVEAVNEPTIVRKEGMVYREMTGAERESYFSYRFEFDQPGAFYMLELAYPDDGMRVFDVCISTKYEKVWTNSQSGVGAETGGKFHNSGEMKALQWIHVADSGVHSVDVLNVRDGWKAAAASLKVYRILNELPAMEIGTARPFGIHSERCYFTSGIGTNFGWDCDHVMLQNREERPLMQKLLASLVFAQEAAENYLRYLRFCGQTTHIMGCIQYNEFNSPFIPFEEARAPSLVPCMRRMAANVFELNGMDFLAGMEYVQSRNVRTFSNNSQMAQGEDSCWMVDADGEQFYGFPRFTICGNWLDTDYVSTYYKLLRRMAETFGEFEHFKGVSNFIGPSQITDYYPPAFVIGNDWDNPLALSYDDQTFRAFAEETGRDLGIDTGDVQRFSKRAAAVREDTDLRAAFFDFRCRKLRDFYAGATTAIDAENNALLFLNVLTVEIPPFYHLLASSGRTFDEMMREMAIDIGLLGSIPNNVVVRWVISWRSKMGWPSQDPYAWMAKERDVVISAFERQPRNIVLCRTSWDENWHTAPGYIFNRAVSDQFGNLLEGSDWILDGIRTRALPQPSGVYAREAAIQAIITADPEMLLTGFTDLNINVGHVQALRDILRVYTCLPQVRFEAVLDTDLETNLAIRKLDADGGAYLYIANPGYWPIRGTVRLVTGAPLLDLPTGTEAAGAGEVEIAVDLPPFGLAGYRTSAPTIRVASWKTENVETAYLAHMTGILDGVETALDTAVLRPAEEDAAFLRTTIANVREALGDNRCAYAWSLIKHHRFWTAWESVRDR